MSDGGVRDVENVSIHAPYIGSDDDADEDIF